MCKWRDSLIVYFTPLLLILCSFPLSSMSQECKLWENLGIYGGTIYKIAIDPCEPNRMFAGSFMGDGLFLTEDGGNNWQPVETANESFGEDTFKNHAVYAVKIAPGNSKIVWVAHDYWAEKSIDWGQTWTHISNSKMQFHCTNCRGEGDDLRICRSLAIDPVDSNIVYVGTSGPNNTYTSGAIYKTFDGGSTWKKIGYNDSNEFDYMVMDLDIDPQNNNIIWAVTNSEVDADGNGSLYRSHNGGDSWEKIFPSEHSSSTSGFFTVAVKPNDSNTVFTGSGSGIIKHYFSNKRWESEWPIPDSRLVRDISFDPQDPDKVYTTWEDPQSEDLLPKFAMSINGGMDWVVYTIGLVNPEKDKFLTGFLTLAVHPSDGNIIFGGESNLGVYKSQNRGQTWISINNGINAMIVNDAAIDPNNSTHIITGTHCGVYKKDQNGDWLHCTREKTDVVVFQPKNTQIFYAGVEDRLGKTIDGGNNWIYSADMSDGKDYISSIAIDPVDPDTLFISVAEDGIYGRIYKSKGEFLDGGDWFGEPVLSRDYYNFNVVAIDPSNNKHIFAGGGKYDDTNVVGDLYESTEGGESGTWEPTGLTGVIVNDLLINPEDPNIMYVGCGDSRGTKIPIYTTMDGGEDWESSCKGMHREFLPLYGYNVWGASSTDIFVVGEEGTISHYDGAWSAMNSGTKKWLSDVWGSSSTDIFAVGERGAILHYDGTWSSINSGTKKWLSDVWGSSSTDIFVIGEEGIILHYNGTWSAMNSGTKKWLGGIWGTLQQDNFAIFVVGDVGTILHYDGSAWSAMDSNTTEGLWSVWGASSQDVFAVGTNGAILHYDGSAWSAMNSNTTKGLWSVWGASSQDVFVVGSKGTILHYDGSTWSAMNSNITENLMSVWGISSTNVFATGDRGTILQYDGSTWTKMNAGRRKELPTDVGDSQMDDLTTARSDSSDHSDHSSMHTRDFGEKTRSSVTDLEFHPKNKNIIYASTMTDGIFISENQGSNWQNLAILPYYVYAIATGSFISCTSGGLQDYLCGISYIVFGYIVDDFNKGIDKAGVRFDCNLIEYIYYTKPNGRYDGDILAGCYDLTATAEGYMDETLKDIYICAQDFYISGNIISLHRPPIQPRINDPNAGNVIIIDPGIYYENIDFNGKGIILRSIDPNDPNIVSTTIIDGNQAGSVVTFNKGEGGDSILSGITLRNGLNTNGGGIYCDSSSPLISNCIITENSAVNNGGGIYCDSSSPLISNCIITENSAVNNGGGIYCDYNSMPMIINIKMLNNKAGEQQNQICQNADFIIFSDMQIVNYGSTENVCTQRYNHSTGKWEPFYRFFGTTCGQNNPIYSDEYLFISYFP